MPDIRVTGYRYDCNGPDLPALIAEYEVTRLLDPGAPGDPTADPPVPARPPMSQTTAGRLQIAGDELRQLAQAAERGLGVDVFDRVIAVIGDRVVAEVA